jgi:hypothetical protein
MKLAFTKSYTESLEMVFYLSEVDVFSILLSLDAEKSANSACTMYRIRKRLSCSNIRDSEIDNDFVMG